MPPDPRDGGLTTAGAESSVRRDRVLLVVNPSAGSGRGAAAAELTAEVLCGRAGPGPDAASGLEVTTVRARSAAELRELAVAELARGAAALVVVGGDGTVNLGVTLTAGTSVPLGIVAAGTGNDNARELGLRVGDVRRAANAVRESLAGHLVRPVDAVRWSTGDGATGWFSGVLGAGFDAIVNERANGWHHLRGRIRYDLAILRELPVFRPRAYTVELDGATHRLRAVLVAVGNGPSYGGGMRICHGARMDDGLLDVVIAGPVSRIGLLRLYPKVWSGRHLADPRVRRLTATRVRLSCPGIIGYADGERLGPLPLTCEVVPGALRLLAP